MKKASFFKRALAHLVDIFIITLVVQLPFSILLNNARLDGTDEALLKIIIETMLLVCTLVFWVKCKGTPGKLLLKLSVVSACGKDITIKQSVIRYFSYLLSLIPLGAGFFWALYDSEGRCWHDILSRTRVIKRC